MSWMLSILSRIAGVLGVELEDLTPTPREEAA
jgi:hypothetical protein